MIGQSSTFADMGCLDIESEIFMDPEAGVNLASKYPIHFEKLDLIVLKTQIQTTANMFKKLQVSSVHDVIKQFIALPEAFDQLLKLSHIFITFPFSSASTERFFSALKRVNNCVRGTMNTERLSNLLVICTESSFVKTVDQNKLVDNFGKKIADIQFCCKF